MKPDRAPSTVWSVSAKDINTYVRTLPDDKILIVGPDYEFTTDLGGIMLSRSQARAIAKRITQCLDATVKR